MTTTRAGGPESRDNWLDADALKSVPVREVLDRYGLLENLVQRGPTASGPSPFPGGGTLSINETKNVWNDSCGRPQIEDRTVPGNVIGLVQALENVPFRRALEILHERFNRDVQTQAEGTRARTSSTLRQEGVQAKTEDNVPFGKELKGLKFDVPFLREQGIDPQTAKEWGVGWCSRGLMRSRVVFPIRNALGTVMAYTGLSPKADAPDGRWKFPSGFHRAQELFGIDRVYQDEAVRQDAHELGLTLAEDPLEVLRLIEGVRGGSRAIVSPMGAELSELQISALLDQQLNPTGRLTLAGESLRRHWATALIRRAWLRYADPSDDLTH